MQFCSALLYSLGTAVYDQARSGVAPSGAEIESEMMSELEEVKADDDSILLTEELEEVAATDDSILLTEELLMVTPEVPPQAPPKLELKPERQSKRPSNPPSNPKSEPKPKVPEPEVDDMNPFL